MNVTVIISVLNGEATIGRALQSIASQDTPIFEVIIVNDGSTDKTKSIVESWANSLPIALLNNPENIGVAPSRSISMHASSGDIVFVLDADDSWEPDHVSTILEMAEKNPKAVLFSTRAHYRNQDGELTSLSPHNSDATIRTELMWDNPLVHSSMAFLRETYFLTEGYSTKYTWDDYFLWIQLLRHGQLAASPKTTVNYFEYANSLSRIKKKHSLDSRFQLQTLAIKSFARQHPLPAIKNLAIVMIRKLVKR